MEEHSFEDLEPVNKHRLRASTPEVHYKGWGAELWIANNDKYCGKVLRFDRKDSRSSAHFHLKKDETWWVIGGNFAVEMRDKETGEIYTLLLEPGNSLHIPIGHTHQVQCLSDEGMIIEVSTPHYEEDSYRVAPGDSQKQT